MGASPPPLCAPSSSFFPSLARPPLLAVSPRPCWPPWALRVLWRCEGVGSSPLRWSLLVPWCVFYKLTLLAAILRCGRHHRSRRKAPAPFPLKSISSPPPVCVCVCAFLRQRRSSPCPCRAALRAHQQHHTLPVQFGRRLAPLSLLPSCLYYRSPLAACGANCPLLHSPPAHTLHARRWRLPRPSTRAVHNTTQLSHGPCFSPPPCLIFTVIAPWRVVTPCVEQTISKSTCPPLSWMCCVGSQRRCSRGAWRRRRGGGCARSSDFKALRARTSVNRLLYIL